MIKCVYMKYALCLHNNMHYFFYHDRNLLLEKRTFDVS